MQRQVNLDSKVTTCVYWAGAVGDREELHSCRETLRRILNGEGRSLNLEELRGHPGIFSARIVDKLDGKIDSRSNRLIFTTTELDGQYQLVVLAVVKNHAYDKCKALQPAVLARILNKEIQQFAKINASSFDSFDGEVKLGHPANPSYQIKQIYQLNDKVIMLDGEQEAATSIKLPGLISGPAGSGKTLLALQRMLEVSTEQNNDRILYVTQSASLVSKIKKDWERLCVLESLISKVDFCSTAELVKNKEDRKLVDKTDFETWFRSIDNSTKQNILEYASCQPAILDRASDIYQELKILSAIASLDDYLALGREQVIFGEATERVFTYQIYRKYLQYLAIQRQYDLVFSELDSQQKYRCVLVDEAQQLSMANILDLVNMSEKGNQFCLFEDSNQNLHGGYSHYLLLKNILFARGVQLNEAILKTTHRSPENIIRVANVVLRHKNMLRQGVASSIERAEMIPSHDQTRIGRVSSFTQNKLDLLLARIKNDQLNESVLFSVVTHPEFVQEARKKFNTPLVFTPAQIGGLEYPIIVVYRMFDIDVKVMKEANASLRQIKQTQLKLNKPKQYTEKNQKVYSYLNQIYVAMTRATAELIIIQDNHHHLESFLEPMNRLIAEINLPRSSASSSSSSCEMVSEVTEVLAIKKATAEEWQQEADKIREHGAESTHDIIKDITDKIQSTKNENNEIQVVHQSKKAKKMSAISVTRTSSSSITAEVSKKIQKDDQLKMLMLKYVENMTVDNTIKIFSYRNWPKLIFDTTIADHKCTFFELILGSQVRQQVFVRLCARVLERYSMNCAEMMMSAFLDWIKKDKSSKEDQHNLLTNFNELLGLYANSKLLDYISETTFCRVLGYLKTEIIPQLLVHHISNCLDSFIFGCMQSKKWRERHEMLDVILPNLHILDRTMPPYMNMRDTTRFGVEIDYLIGMLSRQPESMKDLCVDGRYFLAVEPIKSGDVQFPRLLSLLMVALLSEELDTKLQNNFQSLRSKIIFLIKLIDEKLGLFQHLDMKHLTDLYPVRAPLHINSNSVSILMLMMQLSSYIGTDLMNKFLTSRLLSSSAFIDLMIDQYIDLIESEQRSHFLLDSAPFYFSDRENVFLYFMYGSNGSMIFNLLAQSNYFVEKYITEDLFDKNVNYEIMTSYAERKIAKCQEKFGELCKKVNPSLHQGIKKILETKMENEKSKHSDLLSQLTQLPPLRLFDLSAHSTGSIDDALNDVSESKISNKFN